MFICRCKLESKKVFRWLWNLSGMKVSFVVKKLCLPLGKIIWFSCMICFGLVIRPLSIRLLIWLSGSCSKGTKILYSQMGWNFCNFQKFPIAFIRINLRYLLKCNQIKKCDLLIPWKVLWKFFLYSQVIWIINVCINSALLIRVDIQHVYGKFTQLNFVSFLWKFYQFFPMISCKTQIEKISFFFSYKNIEWTHMCF